MSGSASIARGNLSLDTLIQASITPAATVTTGASITSTYPIPGLQVNDSIGLTFLGAITAYLSVGAAWVSAANTLSIQWVNSFSASSSGSPAAIPTIISVSRCENPGLSAIPTVLE